MKKALTTLCLLLVLAQVGCLTTQQGTGVGALGGSAAGAGVGAALGNWGLGAMIGAGIGALSGAVVQDQLDKKRQKKEIQELEEAKGPSTEVQAPSTSGKTFVEGHYEYVKKRKWIDTSEKERVWVDERVEGDRRIEGHYEDRVIPSGYWEEHEEKVWVPDHYE